MSPAVISATVHLVIRVEPELTSTWTDQQVTERGVAPHCPAKYSDELRENRIAVWRMNPDRLAGLRLKLGSLSSFMQALNQPSPSEDDSAVLSAMAYVDLNPIRAAMATDLPSSNHTSAQLRLSRISKKQSIAGFGLKPVAGLCQRQLLDMTEATYLSLVDWSGRHLHPDKTKTGRIADDTPPVLAAMGLSERRWEGQVRGTESIYWRAIGSVDSLLDLTEQLGQNWLRGMRAEMARERPG